MKIDIEYLGLKLSLISEPPLKMKLKRKISFRSVFVLSFLVTDSFPIFSKTEKGKTKEMRETQREKPESGLNYWLECEAGRLGHFISFSNKEGQKQPGKSGKANDGCRWRGLR